MYYYSVLMLTPNQVSPRFIGFGMRYCSGGAALRYADLLVTRSTHDFTAGRSDHRSAIPRRSTRSIAGAAAMSRMNIMLVV
jgi:hypothetical protein